MGEPHASGSTAEPNHIPMLEERVDTLSNQVILLISHYHESANKSVEMAAPVMVFYHPRKRGREMKPKKERHTYLSLCHLSHLMEL